MSVFRFFLLWLLIHFFFLQAFHDQNFWRLLFISFLYFFLLYLFFYFYYLLHCFIYWFLWFLRGDIFSFNFGVCCHLSFHASEFLKNLFVILGLFSVLCVLANFTFQQKNVEIFFMFLAFFCFMFLYYILCFFSFGSFF